MWQLILHSAKSEWRSIRANRWDMATLFWLPLIALVMMWWTFSQEQIVHVPIAVVDHDHSVESRQLIRFLEAAPGLQIVAMPLNNHAAQQDIQAAKVYAAVIIPPDFSRRLKQGEQSPVIAWVNSQFGTHSGIIQRDLRHVILTYSIGVKQKVLLSQGVPFEEIKAIRQPIAFEQQLDFNPTGNYLIFIANTVIPALLHILATVAGAYTLGRELRDKTFREHLHSLLQKTGVQASDFVTTLCFLLGKLIWPMLIYTLWGAFSITVFAQSVHITLGEWLVCFVAYYLLIALSLWLGVLFSAVPISLRMGLSGAALLTAPAFAFSGITFPLYKLPLGASIVAHLLPLTYYLHIQVLMLEQHASWLSVVPNLLIIYGVSWVVMLCAVAASVRALHHPERWGAR